MTPSLPTPLSLDVFTRAAPADLMARYEALLGRIAGQDPALNVFEHGSPDAERVMARVRELCALHPDPADRPPLFGVPVGVKDIFRIAGEAIRCGALLPPRLFAGPEAELVSRLRRAGAVILGRTVTTEFAYFEPGPTCNPHAPDRTPGGSSSGSAAGVAAGFFPLALGTQTVGSVIRPAAYCGVTGFKPSHGRLPVEGLVFFSRSVDHAGLFCASPEDAALTMAAVADAWTPAPAPQRPRLGVPSGPYLDQTSPEALQAFSAALAALGRANGDAPALTVRDAPCLDDIAAIAARHGDLIAREFHGEHAAWFERYEALYRPRTAALLRQGRGLSGEVLAEGRASCADLRARLHAAMDAAGIDAWVCPSALGEADKGLLGTGSPAMNLPWTHAGLPALSIPAGTGPCGLPLGLQLVGRFGRDPELLALGAAVRKLLAQHG